MLSHFRDRLTNPGDCEVLLGVAKIHVWIKGLTGEDLGVSKIKCESDILSLA